MKFYEHTVMTSMKIFPYKDYISKQDDFDSWQQESHLVWNIKYPPPHVDNYGLLY